MDTGMLEASSNKAGPLTLNKIPLDIQIVICTLLHASDILALRQTCKTLQLPTRQRIVWVAALHRVCLDNSLFLPSFPILDMSDAELEQAALAPYRWIELCVAFEKQHPQSPGATLCPKTTRTIVGSLATFDDPELFIVPGGRYMVSYSPRGIFVWDLGYTSNADCNLIASVGPEDGSYDCTVQATPDGMGLIILASHRYRDCLVYEIYPQSEIPQLTQIAHLDFDPPAYLLPDRMFWYAFYENRIIFTIWYYRANSSISFSADVDIKKFEYNLEVIPTKTAIMVLCEEQILVWAIPPLSPQPPDFFDYDPIHIPSLFGIAYPGGIVSPDKLLSWKTMSHWYYGSSQPLYFDILCQDSKLHRFEIIVKPDLLDTSLHLINTEVVPHDFYNVCFERYGICEDTLVACWQSDDLQQCGTYTGLTSSRFTNVISHGGPAARMLLPPTVSGCNFSICPASGRYVHFNDDIIIVSDLF